MSDLGWLGLGTAQFGLDYGATNAVGQVAKAEVRAILANAAAAGVRTLDTAPAYGAAERVLGDLAGPEFELVTKTVKLADYPGRSPERAVREGLEASLNALGRPTVDALLVHAAEDLTGATGDALWRALERLRAEGLTKRIGVSIYGGEQLATLLDRYPLDLVQAPINPLDQRLLSNGLVDRLHRSNVRIHVRSLFLQGVLLSAPEEVPSWLAPMRPTLQRLADADGGDRQQRVASFFAWVRQAVQPECVICGVTSLQQFEELRCAAISKANPMPEIAWTSDAFLESLLDPSTWSTLKSD